jgi:hypothetical protein
MLDAFVDHVAVSFSSRRVARPTAGSLKVDDPQRRHVA